MREQLAEAVCAQIANRGWTQAEAAARLGVRQPRISLLVNGQVDRFSVDALLNMAALVGLQVELRVK